jgi:alkane 1-monooxygenase
LFAVVGPALSTTWAVAHTLGATSLWWFGVSTLVFYGIVPAIDAWLGEDLTNPPESAVPALEADGYYRRILYVTVPVLWASVLINLVYLGTHDLPLVPWLATVMATGAVLGFGLNLSHELGHKTS